MQNDYAPGGKHQRRKKEKKTTEYGAKTNTAFQVLCFKRSEAFAWIDMIHCCAQQSRI